MHVRLLKNYALFILLVITTSCAKEIYTDADAAAAKREAQKVGLTIMVRDVNNPSGNMSGFVVSSLQCGDEINGTTSNDGLANLMVFKGDAVLLVKKEGYITTTAVVTINSAGTERSNTVVMIPIFANTQTSGLIDGTVIAKFASSEDQPVSNALVSVEIDMDELMHMAFPAFTGDMSNYRPTVLSYAATGLLQPVRTDASGAFLLTIPLTQADLTYNINIHETELTQNTYCSAIQKIATNGQNGQTVCFQLTPYAK